MMSVREGWNLMRHTGKHGNLVDIEKLAEPFAIEASPQVGDEDLSALVQTYSFPLEAGLVSEAGEVLGQKVHESRGRTTGTVYTVQETSVEVLT